MPPTLKHTLFLYPYKSLRHNDEYQSPSLYAHSWLAILPLLRIIQKETPLNAMLLSTEKVLLKSIFYFVMMATKILLFLFRRKGSEVWHIKGIGIHQTLILHGVTKRPAYLTISEDRQALYNIECYKQRQGITSLIPSCHLLYTVHSLERLSHRSYDR